MEDEILVAKQYLAFAGKDSPDPDCLVFTSGCYPLSIGGKGDRSNPVGMSSQDSSFTAVDVPKNNFVIKT